MIRFGSSRISALVRILFFLSAVATRLLAADRTLVFSGVPVTVQDVTADVEVSYTSMRLNRALDVWNVEVTVRNISTTAIQGPIALYVESFTGTTGALQADGLDGANAFYDLSNYLVNGALGAGESSSKRTLTLGRSGTATPSITTRVFGQRPVAGLALAHVQTVDSLGHPLGGVTALEVSGAGQRTLVTGEADGLVTLGQGAGGHLWKFSREGYLPSVRSAVLTTNGVTMPYSPRLTARSTNAVTLTPIAGGTVKAGGAQISFGPGAFSQATVATLTPLSAQSLPSLFPLGWSPAQAFWIEFASEPTSEGTMNLTLWGAVSSPNVTLVKWNEQIATWTALAIQAAGTNVSFALNGSGAYAVVVPDSGIYAPPAAAVGEPLQGTTVAFDHSQSLQALGTVTPSSAPASRIAEWVTASAEVIVTNAAGPIPSGLVLHAQVDETYALANGEFRALPRYETDIVAYQQPGDRNANTAVAAFPLRPMLLLGGDELERCEINVDVFAKWSFSGGVFSGGAGQISAGGVRLLASGGGSTNQVTALLRELPATNFFTVAGTNVVRAFQFGMGAEAAGKLAAQFSPAAPNAFYVLARVISRSGIFGVEPVERFTTDSGGVFHSVEPTTGEALRGVRGSGQYVLVRVETAQAVVTGVARNAANQPAPGLPIRSANRWLTFSEAGGVYRTIAPVGSSDISVTDLGTGDTTSKVVVISNGQQSANVDVAASPARPRIVSVSPAAGATNVSVVTPITIEFSEPVNPGSLLPNGIALFNPTNGIVTASLSLNLRGNVASLLPVEALAANGVHTIVVNTNVADLTGLKVEGSNVFTFKTRSDDLNRGAGSQVISFEPTNGVARINGTQGIADPGVPVILVNDTTGETSTVLSKADGSFEEQIRAATDDFLRAVFVNLNGTTNTMPVSRQLFADGRVGLFNGGGTLETQGENGPIQILVEPGSIPNKTIFKVDAVAMTNLPAFVKETGPIGGGKALGGFKISVKGDLPTESVDVVFPVTAQQLGLPAGMHPTNATYCLAIPKQVRDNETGELTTSYELVDRMQWEDGKLVTHSPPFFGLLGMFEDILVTPLLMTVGTSMTVSGRVYAAELYSSGKPIPGTERFLPGAFVSVVPPNSSLPGLPGRIRPGTIFTSAGGTNANYAFMVPVDQGGSIVVRAIHPAFPARDATAIVPALSMADRFIIGNILTPVDIVFPIQNFIDNDAPHISISQTPDYPQVNSNAALRVVTTDNASRPRNTIWLDSATSLDGRTNVSLNHVFLGVTNREDVGAFSKRETVIVSASEPAIVKMLVRSADEKGNERQTMYPITIGGAPILDGNPIPAADTNDVTGPRVVSSFPTANSTGFAPGAAVVLKFDEPIDRAVLREAPTIFAMMPGNLRPVVQLSEDQYELSLYFSDLLPNTTYTLTMNSGVRDVSGNRLDQDPTIDGNNSYTLTFKTTKQTETELPEMHNGGGVVIRGIYAYALERSGSLGRVNVYDLSNPSAPNRVAQFLTQPFPRDLVLIPHYSFTRSLSNVVVETKDLLAVVGGQTGLGNRPWLNVVDISNPLDPQRLTSVALSLNPENVVSKVQWSAPTIGYVENSSRFGMIGLVDLQTLILAEYLTREEFLMMPRHGQAGIDANGDGDYVDAGDVLPKPAREPLDFSGKIATYGTQDTDQWIRDFAMEDGGAFVGVVLDAGHVLGTNGLPTDVVAPASYRTLVAGTILEREPTTFVFTNARPRSVTLLPHFPLVVNREITSVNLALVPIVKDINFRSAYTNALAVLNVTDALDPRLLVEIPMPPGSDDSLWSVQFRDDGLLMLATEQSVVLVDPTRFQATWDRRGVHPAIAGVIPKLGDTQTFAGTLAGLNAISSGGRNLFVQTAPLIQVVHFPTNAPFNVQALVDSAETNLLARLQQFRTADSLYPARYRTETGVVTSAISPPLPLAHYYVMLRAPGSAGATINVALEALNWAGEPLRKRGFLFPPVHALSADALNAMDQAPGAEDAPVRPLVAYRMSSNPASDFYNIYLSRPFVLTYEEMSKSDIASIQAEVDREVIWGGDYLRVSIDPSGAPNPAVAAFAGKVDASTKSIIPGIELVVPSYRADFIQSPNPGPMFGGVRFDAALNAINAHSGELVINATDMTLPGRRLPIEFTRTSAGQALFDGPFGRGWDFNFNQRVVELQERIFPQGSKIPLVARGNGEDEVAGGGDLLFYTGAGRIVGYRFAGTNAPTEIANDPLVLKLGWTNKAARYYLPPEGVFSIMLKFKDGRYVRLEPDGKQYWFNSAGRLAKIYDRYDKNSLEMVYNARGELIRIFDEARRATDIAYYRLANDPERRANIDVTTDKTVIAGKIARIIDYSKRDILYFYRDDGLLDRREGPKVETEAPGGFTGRQVVRYIYSDASDAQKSGKSLIGMVGGDDNGTPLISATEVGARGRDTVSKLKLATGDVRVELAQNSTARAIASGDAKSKIFAADGSTSEYTFDAHGRPKMFVASGSGTNAVTVTNRTDYYPNGLVKKVTYPEGNSAEYFYDLSNPNIRSRANLVRMVKNPGPRGGAVLEATTEYDDWYNLPSGTKKDFNGNAATITLTLDHRETERVTRGGVFETYSVNEYGQVESHTAIDGIVRSQTYTPEGFIQTSSVGPLTTTYSYAPNSGVTSDQTLRGLASAIQDPEGIVTEYVYDERNQLVKQKRGNLETTHAYNANGDIVETRSTVDDGRVLVEKMEYNQVGFRLKRTIKDVETEQGVVDLVEKFEPDAANRLSVMTAPGGDRHITTYDSLGRIESYEIEGVYKETYRYDGNGNLIEKEIGDSRERYFYDGHDRRTNVVTATGAEIILGLDGNGNLTNKVVKDISGRVLSESHYTVDPMDRYTRVDRIHDGLTSEMKYDYFPGDRKIVMTDALNAVSTVYYDDAGREVRTETPTKTHIKAYDRNNNLKRKETVENGKSYVETYEYNGLNQLTNVTDNLGHSSAIVVGLDGRVKTTIDRENHAQTNEYTLLGELTADFTANGVVTRYGYSTNRDSAFASDGAGRAVRQLHDASGRLLATILPNNEATTYTNFNALLKPQKVSMPRGVTMTLAYDEQGQLTNRVVAGIGPNIVERYAFDGMHRPTLMETASGSLGFEYDQFEVARTFTNHYALRASPAATLDFALKQSSDKGGYRATFTYPNDSLTVTNRRDTTGRLLGLLPNAGEAIIKDTDFAGDRIIGARTLGNNRIRFETVFDDLKRPVTRRYVRSSDGKALIDVRYAYDKSGAQLARQFVHRAGRADFFEYDDGYRLRRADIGARLRLDNEETRVVSGFVVPTGVQGNWAAGAFARIANYDDSDLLTSITIENPDHVEAAAVASQFGPGDSLMFIGQIDAFSRSRDEVGNVTRAELFVRVPGSAVPEPVVATLEYNALGQLARITRDDGVVIVNEYNPVGLRIRRQVTGDPGRCVSSDVAFIYDGANLVEVRDLQNSTAVVARFYYADDGDELIAGDLANTGGILQRHYFLTDTLRSVLGIADAQGQLVERATYDIWGQPQVESADNTAPVISRVTQETNSFLVQFSEPILPTFTDSTTTNLLTSVRTLSDMFVVRSGGVEVGATIWFDESRTPFGSTFRVIPNNALAGMVELELRAGVVQDDANNPNAGTALTLNLASGNTLFTGPSFGSTAASRLSRSIAPFGFHGQVFDFDAGLLYCRARFYDPHTGMFLQRDPAGFTDGVNHYAGFANNPVNLRDPSGLAVDDWGRQLTLIGSQASYKEDGIIGYAVGNILMGVGAVLQLGTGAAEGVDILEHARPGTWGLIDAMHGAELITSDYKTGIGAFGSMYGAGKAIAGRIQGYLSRVTETRAANRRAKNFLYSKGWHGVEPDSIVKTMKEMNVTELSVRDFRDKAKGRKLGGDLGLPKKPGFVATKTSGELSSVTHQHWDPHSANIWDRTYTGDLDILSMKIGGRRATPAEVNRFIARANINYAKAWRKMGNTGVPNVPFRHGAHVHLADMYGKSSGGKMVDNDLIKKIGHPGDAVSIRIDGDGWVSAYQTPRSQITSEILESEVILKANQRAMGHDAVGFPFNWHHWPY